MANISFIGAGNMARSIIGGLLAQGTDPATLTASDLNLEAMSDLSAQGLRVTDDNSAACRQADVIVLAVKPQILKAVALGLNGHLDHNPLIISVAAGITSTSLTQWLGKALAIVRCMPNTPALVQQGATGLFANAQVSIEQRALAESLLGGVGVTVWVDNEVLIDSVTAVSGSGPAYFFLLMEAMIAAGIKQGLTPEQARTLTLQTAAGAATLASQSDVDVAELRRRVTSPGGTTEQALLTFEQANMADTVDAAMAACAARAKTMATEFS